MMHQTITVDPERSSAPAPRFHPGQIVVLNSGGPPMTVQSTVRREGEDGQVVEFAVIYWFVGPTLAQHEFPAACLTPVQAVASPDAN